MQIIAILIGLVLLAAIAYYVSRPLMTPRRASSDVTAIATLEIQRDAIYAQIRELDMDHATGKTNEEDYQRIRAELVAQAAAILKQIDTLGAQPLIDVPVLSASMTSPVEGADDVETLIAARRKTRSVPAAKSAVDDVEAAIAARRKTTTVTKADTAEDVEALIAARRKSTLATPESVCPNCGKPIGVDDVFCSKCGAALKKQPVV